MNHFVRVLPVVAAALVCLPAPAQAGMPSITLTDMARMRVQTISFFLAGLLLSSWLVQRLWNYLRRDFSSLPRLSYGKALGVVVLWGLLFVLVLTMISGARELMTPGAWEKQGLTYKLAQDRAATAQQLEREPERREALERLRLALQQYAENHDGQFPRRMSEAGLDEEHWLTPGPSPARYLYVAGLRADGKTVPLVYEPDVFGDVRLVLLSDGTIQEMTVAEILASLPPEGR